MMLKLNRVSFGGTAATVTSIALIIGLNTANASQKAIITALLIAGLADNLTDSLSVHIYQESERLQEREAFFGTLTNFAARLSLSLSFVLLVAALPISAATTAALIWGTLLLGAMSYLLARERQVSPFPEVVKHLVVAYLIIFASKGIGYWISI
jgi:VIT1/CCC1 family predicted Fe2+/Mn2+ transporter